MPFEVGKLYTFKENEFEKSRESGKLVFKVRDPASATPYIVKPFEFQITDIPDKIVCIYKGNDRLEQDLNSLVPELYEVGADYRFRVMRQDSNIAAHVSLRDDSRGVTFYPVDLGRTRFERFQRITCRVVSTDNGQLKLSYLKENENPEPKFSVEEVKNLKGGRVMRFDSFFRKLLANPVFDDARLRFREDNPEWILVAMEAVTQNIPLWFSVGTRFRVNLLRQIRDLAIGLIERSEYLNIFPGDDRHLIQRRMSAVISDSEDYLHAAELITGGNDGEFITDTIASLKSTGWLYRPEQKMRLMMALFTLRNSYVHEYIPKIFEVIRDHHADERFLGEFADGFIQMLQIFIENESKFLNAASHDALRELIEAIAIQLLLTQNKEYGRWNLYRGRMYTLAMLLIGRHVDILAVKAFDALTDNMESPLEYSWKDLTDINRLCHANLNGINRSGKKVSSAASVCSFDGQNASLKVRKGNLVVAPALTGLSTREALDVRLSAKLSLSVFLNGKFDMKGMSADAPLSDLHVMWRQLENSLFDPDQKVSVDIAAKAAVGGKLAPGIDDMVTFRVTGRDESDQYTFRCAIEDSVYEGEGVINTRDIVLYPVTVYPETFWQENGAMLFRGKVLSIRPDGLFRLSMEDEVDQEMIRLAQEDRNEDAVMETIITKDLGDSCLGVTDGGYPVLVHKRGANLYQGLKAGIRVTEIGWNKKSDKPYIAGLCEEVYEDSDKDENYRAVRDSFHFLLTQMSGGRIWTPPADGKDSAEPVVTSQSTLVALPDSYLTADAVNGLARLFDAMAFVAHDNINEVYALLATARLMSLLTGDTYRAQFLSLKQGLVEALSRFVIDGRVDRANLEEMSRKIAAFPGTDADLDRRMEVLRILSTLDVPAMGTEIALPDDTDWSMIGSLKRMVVSYNMLRGLKLNSFRQGLKRSIFDLLNLKMPEEDISRVNASEDQLHEFKESLIYPAGNSMKPDEKKQGLEIAQVICGMLNTEGGTLYIGVANTGVPRGLENDFVYINKGFEEYDLDDVKDKFRLKFCNILREHIGVTVEGIPVYPSLVTLEFDDIDDNCFAVVSVRRFKGAVRLTDGSMFVRQDSSTVPVKKKTEQASLEKNRKSGI